MIALPVLVASLSHLFERLKQALVLLLLIIVVHSAATCQDLDCYSGFPPFSQVNLAKGALPYLILHPQVRPRHLCPTHSPASLAAIIGECDC